MDSIQSMQTQSRPLRWRKIGFAIWIILFVLLLAIHWYPIRFGALRLVIVADIFVLWLGTLWLTWNQETVRRVLLTLSVLSIIFIFSPSRSINPLALRQAYVQALQKYEGTTYIWGGESKRGIDCSGLMRCALVDANMRQSLTTFKSSALRFAFSMWWNDLSAKAMKEEYRGKTRLLFTSPTINNVKYSALEPGDIAVTSSGVHVLAYIGNKTWIEADPNELQGNRVIKVQTPTHNPWFNMPVHIMRWRQFEES